MNTNIKSRVSLSFIILISILVTFLGSAVIRADSNNMSSSEESSLEIIGESEISDSLSQSAPDGEETEAPINNERQLRPIEDVIRDLDKVIFLDKLAYSRYFETEENKPNAKNKKNVVINSSNIINIEGDGFEVLESYHGKPNVILTQQSGLVTFQFEVEEEGLYFIDFKYIPIKDVRGGYQIERKMMINNSLPFFESSSIIFDRTFTSKNPEIVYDGLNNQIKPIQTEIIQWTTMQFKDRIGTSDGPYKVYFNKGTNTIELISLRESVALSEIILYEEPIIKSYDQVRNTYPDAISFFASIQGEDADFVNDMLLQPVPDRTSALTEPYDYYGIRYNIMGGQHFKKPGQKIEWLVNVEEEGMYNLAFRAKQSAKRDVNAYVNIMINGVIPYEESKNIVISYSNDWRKLSIGNNDGYYKVPLKAGENIITIEIVAHKNADYVKELETSILRLNNCSRQILMLTGSQPDKFRDYQFEIRLPEVLQIFEYEGKRLYDLVDIFVKNTGSKGADSVIIENVARQITDMAKNPYSIAERLDNFRNNLTGMAAWLTTIKDIPIDIDSLAVYSDDKVHLLPRYSDTFFTRVKKEIFEFFATFIYDYRSIGIVDDNQKTIRVWIGTGRDQAQIIKSLSDAYFTSENNIAVNIQLISNSMLMPSIMAGTAPDIALQQGNIVQQGSQGIANQVGTLAVEWGLRGALYPLNFFADYKEVLEERFTSSAYEPLGYEGVYYALPETIGFPMLFYRTDVLNDLGLTAPKTWQDVIRIIPVLQNNNMQFGFNFDFFNFNTMLMQNGGTLYNSTYSKVALDTPEAIKTFKEFTEYSTIYRLPLMFDFNNRFRTGETPIGIADFSTYNILQVLAPEIDGLWNFSEIPGTYDENGKMNNSSVLMPSSTCFIIRNTKHPLESWLFLKWWTSTEIQSIYAREIESILGGSGRYHSANNAAFSNQLWTFDSLKLLEKQRENTKTIPQILGGYMVVRHFDNAFRSVVLSTRNGDFGSGGDPRNSLLKYIEFMNNELELKKSELKMLQFE